MSRRISCPESCRPGLQAALAGLALVGLTAPAHAQDAAELSAILSESVRCQEPAASTDLSFNIAMAGGDDPALIAAALAIIAADPEVCQPVREAALAQSVARAAEVDPDVSVMDAARAAVDATLADAARRAAAMKFEVGPPPFNLSRTRRGGS